MRSWLYCNVTASRSRHRILMLCAVAFRVAAVRGGVGPPPPVPTWAAGFTDGSVVQQLVDDSIKSGAATVKITAGNYRFTGKHSRLVVAGAANLIIEGEGSSETSLWFMPGYGVAVVDSVNVTVKSLSADCLTPPHSQGTIVANNATAHTIVVDIDEGFPLLDDGYLFNSTCDGDSQGRCSEIKVVFWDPTTRQIATPQQMSNPMVAASCIEGTRRCTATTVVSDPISNTPPGTLVTFSPRMWASDRPLPTFYAGTWLVYNCTRANFIDIATYGSADMVWVETLGYGSNIYKNISIRRRPDPPYPPRLLAANDDGFHSMSVGRGPTLEDSEISYLADDFINVHNRVLPLQSLDLVRHTATIMDVGCTPGVGFTGPTQDGSLNTHVTHVMPFIQPGDALKLYDVGTDHLLGALVVKSTQWANRQGQKIPPLPLKIRNRVESDAIQMWHVTFDPDRSTLPVKPISEYSALVQIDRFSSFGAVIQRNHFHDSYNNVGRFAASNLMFQSNTVERCGDGIHVSYDIVPGFLEGSLGMQNISFVDNKFNHVPGCGSQRSGAQGCSHICSNFSCVLSHVDSDLLPQVHAMGNVVRTDKHTL